MAMTRPCIQIRADELHEGIPYKRCPKCGEMKALDDFGLRRKVGAAKDGRDVIAAQSWCHPCRVPGPEATSDPVTGGEPLL